MRSAEEITMAFWLMELYRDGLVPGCGLVTQEESRETRMAASTLEWAIGRDQTEFGKLIALIDEKFESTTTP